MLHTMKKEINWPLWVKIFNSDISKVNEQQTLTNEIIAILENEERWHYCTSLTEVNAILNTSLNSEQVLKLINDSIDTGSCSLDDVECIAEIASLQPKFIKVVEYDSVAINDELRNRFNQVSIFVRDANSFRLFMKALVIISQVWDEEVTNLVYNNNHKIAWYSGNTLHELIWDTDEIKLVK